MSVERIDGEALQSLIRHARRRLSRATPAISKQRVARRREQPRTRIIHRYLAQLAPSDRHRLRRDLLWIDRTATPRIRRHRPQVAEHLSKPRLHGTPLGQAHTPLTVAATQKRYRPPRHSATPSEEAPQSRRLLLSASRAVGDSETDGACRRLGVLNCAVCRSPSRSSPRSCSRPGPRFRDGRERRRGRPKRGSRRADAGPRRHATRVPDASAFALGHIEMTGRLANLGCAHPRSVGDGWCLSGPEIDVPKMSLRCPGRVPQTSPTRQTSTALNARKACQPTLFLKLNRTTWPQLRSRWAKALGGSSPSARMYVWR